jgi:HD-GYP domain-containing protein (c-di-GMP phosphodiesterase class II)
MSIYKDQPNSDCFTDVGLLDFLPVKVRSLFPGSTLPCDFYFPSLLENEEEIQLEKIMTAGELYPEENYCTPFEQETDIVYIKTKDEQSFLSYLMDNTQKVVKSGEMPDRMKTQLLFDNAEAVVKKVFREHADESNVAAGKKIVEDIAAQITSGRLSLTALLSIFSKDYYTFSHCVQVATLGMSFGSFLGWSMSEIGDFGFGALFHDLGKNSISDNILNKPGRLEKHEFEIIKQHPFTGYQQLKQTGAFSKDQLDTILYHHEALDGSGYPEGLSGKDIPYFARAAHIVDVFDALTSKRAYKGALSREQALALMSSEMQFSFDAELLDAFCRCIERGDKAFDNGGSQLKAEIGTLASIECEALSKKTKSILVGMEAGNYVILRLADAEQAQKLQPGAPLIVRYIYAGEAYGFKGKILKLFHNPVPLIMVTYPEQVERLSLRHEPRQECYLPAAIEVSGKTIRCITVNLSYRGCRVFVKSRGSDKSSFVLKEEPILLRTNLPGRDDPVLLRGQVKNESQTEEGTYMGIQFHERSEQAVDQWKAFIDDILELTR